MNVRKITTQVLKPPPILREGQHVEILKNRYFIVSDKQEVLFEGAVQTKTHFHIDKSQ